MVNPLVIGLVGAIVGVLGVAVGKNIIAKQNADGSMSILQDGKELAKLPPIKLQAYAFLQAFLDRKSSAVSIITAKPQMTFQNPLGEKKARVFNISLIPDTNFKTHGAFEIRINGRILLERTPIGILTDVSSYSIPIPDEGLEIFPKQTVDIYMINDDSLTNVTLTASIMIGEYL